MCLGNARMNSWVSPEAAVVFPWRGAVFGLWSDSRAPDDGVGRCPGPWWRIDVCASGIGVESMDVTSTGRPTAEMVWGHAMLLRSWEGSRRLLTVVGDLDFTCAGAFGAACAAVAAEGSDVTIDMADVAIMDAAGLDAIARVRRFFEILGLALAVRAPSSPVRLLLGLRDLDDLVERPDATRPPHIAPDSANSLQASPSY